MRKTRNLHKYREQDRRDLERITTKLEHDVFQLLAPVPPNKRQASTTTQLSNKERRIQNYRTLKIVARAKQRWQSLQQRASKNVHATTEQSNLPRTKQDHPQHPSYRSLEDPPRRRLRMWKRSSPETLRSRIWTTLHHHYDPKKEEQRDEPKHSKKR